MNTSRIKGLVTPLLVALGLACGCAAKAAVTAPQYVSPGIGTLIAALMSLLGY